MPPRASPPSRPGFLGVSVFFTLSGYLVTTLLLRQSEQDGGLDVRRFWARRLRRLAPVSLVVVLFSVVMSATYWQGMRAIDAAAGIFGFMNWNVIASGESELLRTIVGPLGPYWSLAIEEQFYALLTITVVIAVRTARPIRMLAIVVGICWALSLLVQLVSTGPQFRLEFGTDTRGSELLAGCGLALLLHVRPGLTVRYGRLLAAAGPLIAAVFVALVLTTDYDPPWLLRGGYGAVSIASAVLVASLLDPAPLTQVLAVRPAVEIGRLSYSWYVVHWPIILLLTADRTGFDGWGLVAVKVVVTGAAAALLHVAIEQPVRRLTTPPGRTAAIFVIASVSILAVAVVTM